jgi:hypothetical protein
MLTPERVLALLEQQSQENGPLSVFWYHLELRRQKSVAARLSPLPDPMMMSVTELGPLTRFGRPSRSFGLRGGRRR